MPDWVLAAGVVLLAAGLVSFYFLLPKTIPIPHGVSAAGRSVGPLVMVALLGGLAALLWSSSSPTFPDADLRRCAEAHGESSSPDYEDDDHVACVDDVTGDRTGLRST